MRKYSPAEKLELLEEMKQLIEEIIPEHERLWLARNRTADSNAVLPDSQACRMQ